MIDSDIMIDPTTLTNVCFEKSKNSDIDILHCSIMKIMDSSLDRNRGIDKIMELGFNVEDYTVATGKRGQMWRVNSEYCIQLIDSRNCPRTAYCVLFRIIDVKKIIRKLKLLQLSGQI